MSVEFLVTSFIIIVSPGTGVLYTLAIGLSRGSRASVVAAFGCTLGIVPHMAAAILGLAALLHTSALAFQTFKYVGVGLSALHGLAGAPRARRAQGGEGGRRALGRAAHRHRDPDQHPQSEVVDFLSGLPAAVHQRGREPSAAADADPERGFYADDVVVFVGYGLFAASIRDRIISRPRVLTWMRRTFAAAFAALGAKLALSDR